MLQFHDRLSAETQYLRFFGPKPRLTRAEAHYLANVDFESRFAIVACAQEDGAECIVGVGRFDITQPGCAEAAVVVRDDHQRRGLGTAILRRLIDIARERGVRSLCGEVLAENERMISLLRANGAEIGAAEHGVIRAVTTIDHGTMLLPTRADGELVGATGPEMTPRP